MNNCSPQYTLCTCFQIINQQIHRRLNVYDVLIQNIFSLTTHQLHLPKLIMNDEGEVQKILPNSIEKFVRQILIVYKLQISNNKKYNIVCISFET